MEIKVYPLPRPGSAACGAKVVSLALVLPVPAPKCFHLVPRRYCKTNVVVGAPVAIILKVAVLPQATVGLNGSQSYTVAVLPEDSLGSVPRPATITFAGIVPFARPRLKLSFLRSQKNSVDIYIFQIYLEDI